MKILLGGLACASAIALAIPAQADEEPCRGKVEHRLQEYNLTLNDMTEVDWIPVTRQHGDRVVGYQVYLTPQQNCPKGNLVIDLSIGCYITNVYTMDDCRVKGISSFSLF